MLSLVARERNSPRGDSAMTLSLRRIGKFAAFMALAAVVLTGAARVGVSRYLSSARGKA